MSVWLDFLVGPRRRGVFTHPRCSSMQSSNIMFTGNRKTVKKNFNDKKWQYENHKKWLHWHFSTFYHWFHLNALYALTVTVMKHIRVFPNQDQGGPAAASREHRLQVWWQGPLQHGMDQPKERLRGTTRGGLRSIYNKDYLGDHQLVLYPLLNSTFQEIPYTPS